MFTYLFFLVPQLIYKTLPISVLVAVLVTLGVLSKQNEVTAFKACGVSLYRLATPILIVSTLFSGGLFGFNYQYVPDANRKQDKLRDEIKGKPKQTYLNPDRTWIMAHDSRIYYYKYFDTAEKVMVDVSIFELDPATFRLKRQIQAQRAHWSSAMRTWVFENGWSSDFRGLERVSPRNNFQATTFPELTEAPDYFLKEAVQERQMNFLELRKYIGDLEQSGLVDTRKLAGAVSPEVCEPAVRADHGDDRGAVRIPGGKSRRDDRYRHQHRDRDRLSRACSRCSRRSAMSGCCRPRWRRGRPTCCSR